MLLRFHQNGVRYLAVIVLALLLAFTVSNLNVGSAHAATNGTGPAASAEAPADVLFWYETNGDYKSPGVNFNFHLKWESNGWGSTGFTGRWGDNSWDNYTCWANCGSGDVYWSHWYQNTGTYSTSGDSSAGGPSNYITVHVV